MVFITLGTQGNQFPRCLQMVEELIDTLHPAHEFIVQLGNTHYTSDTIKCLEYVAENDGDKSLGGVVDLSERDPFFNEAARLIVIQQQGSTSLIQREFL